MRLTLALSALDVARDKTFSKFELSMTYISSKVAKSIAENCLPRCCEISTPCFFAMAMLRGSGGFPICQCPVPAESTSILSPSNLDAKIPSAKGERQMFPRHTMSIFLCIFYTFKRKEFRFKRS